MGKKAFDEKLAALASEDEAGLRKALKDRNNYLVGRAAALLGERGCEGAVPDLLAAYERFFQDPVKNDPQCWAKNAIAVALKVLGHREPATYIRGMGHIQMEPVYGGKADTAITLRGTCALALIDCPMTAISILRHLTVLLADAEAGARLDAVRAITHMADPSGILLLRLKALSGDSSQEVLGQCFSALLACEAASDAVPFIERFLAGADTDTQLEAACALAQSAEPQALEAVKRYWDGRLPAIEIRRAILLNLGASPLRAAFEFLREVTESRPDLAATAREALTASRFARESN